jgi:hypothetical protein
MPPEQGLGLDEEAFPVSGREQLAQPGEHGPARPTKIRPRHLAAQNGNLVAQHDNLDGQFLRIAP